MLYDYNPLNQFFCKEGWTKWFKDQILGNTLDINITDKLKGCAQTLINKCTTPYSTSITTTTTNTPFTNFTIPYTTDYTNTYTENSPGNNYGFNILLFSYIATISAIISFTAAYIL
ncbi:MAG: hypothetical protein AB8U25_00810 [Rickettsiales endosymbiont of Dermacentor nuttalli]